MKIITEEMRFRKRLCEFALKYGVTKAAKRYHTNRQFVYRQLEKYDGTLRSLALQSRRPHSHPNAHTKEELTLIKQIYSRYGCDGLAEVYVQLRKRGYKRSYGSMLKQIKKIPKEKVKIRKGYTRHKEIRGQYPGDKVQVDIKYVPKECLLFDTIDKKYYQITAIDEFSRKRILEIVDEKSVTNTSKFIRTLEEKMGLKINTIQTDNGPEFVNNQIETNLPTLFELTLKDLGMIHRRTRPYSPWQNGKVERSHKIDGERFYSRNEFTSEEDLKKKLKRYNARYNNIAKKVLDFKSPNQIVEEYKLNFLSA
ncbi:MAG: DDE-type integrase/transposase/recombinase [Bacilli bacterium]|jgi:transposase InsO family protein